MLMAKGDITAPTLTISVVSVTDNIASMQIIASEEVTGFAVGDISVSAGGSLANFATADNIAFTVDWTLAAGTNTMDIAAGVCTDAAGNGNVAAQTYTLVYLTLQPDATTGVDTFIFQGDTAINYGIDTRWFIGNVGAGLSARQLIKFDYSTIPAESTIHYSDLQLCPTQDNSSNARTYRVFRQKRAWLEGTRNGATDNPATGATWIRYDTTNNWATAGGFGSDDCEQTDIGTCAFSATETLNVFKKFVLVASKIQEMIPSGVFTNNGFLIKADTENTDAYVGASSDHATVAYRPKHILVYSPPFPDPVGWLEVYGVFQYSSSVD